eukprot:12746954-Alexandrium_andersonii.AAC.1
MDGLRQVVGHAHQPDHVARKPVGRPGDEGAVPGLAARACELVAAGQEGAGPIGVPSDEGAPSVAADEEVAQPVLDLVRELHG